MLPLRRVQQFMVSHEILGQTLMALQRFGAEGYEGLVLWLGTVANNVATVERAFVPSQHAIAGDEGMGYLVTSDTLFELNVSLSQSGLRLLAQVHSHPGAAYHSHADDKYAIVTEDGGLSIVVPNFGDAADPTSWAHYRLERDYWRRIPSEELAQLLKIAL